MNSQTENIRTDFLVTRVSKPLLVVNIILALSYFIVLAFFFPIGNPILFGLLIAGEVFHMWQVLTFIYTVWDTTDPRPAEPSFAALAADVFITVAGEPVALVEQTIRAASAMDYPDFHITVLNDGYVAGQDNWRDIEELALELGVSCITRQVGGGAKAGNINNALALTHNPLVAIFDADHVPHRDFLRKTAAYFSDPSMGFVQTPQFYRNYGENYVTKSSWEQQEIFFGPICKGKNRLNAATMCGTNMLVRREAFEAIGGMNTTSIAEDFVTGLLMHRAGYRSVYVPEVLAEGLATEDLLTYSKQQFRWARGALDIIFRWNPLFMRGLSWAQKIQYLSSASFYLTGLFVVIDAMLPVIYLYTGAVPVEVSGMVLAGIFLPYFFLTLYTIQSASNFTFSFSSLCFSMGSFAIHLRALAAAVTFRRSAFAITQKYRTGGAFVRLVAWHIIYVGIVIAGIPLSFTRDGLSASLINNFAWALLNIVIFLPFIRAALAPEGSVEEEPAAQVEALAAQ
jgi:cellulose synthase (UDP-forming)